MLRVSDNDPGSRLRVVGVKPAVAVVFWFALAGSPSPEFPGMSEPALGPPSLVLD